MLPTSDDNDIYLMNNSYDYPSTSRSPINSLNHHQYSTHPSQQLSNPQHSKLANINTITTSASVSSSTSSPNYDAYEYDTFFRKPMIRPPPSHATYPHSPPHEDMKYKPNPLSHTPSSTNPPVSSHWAPSLISQLSDNAKTAVPPPLRQPASSFQKDDLILSQQQQQHRGRKRSIQSTSSISSSPPAMASSATVDSGHKHTIKRLRTLDN
ncbi:hypothetical protein BCR42DRAFT_68772 [Absidia repens]|uniref:Uncharacterized protein n=1 Tax=Absidia repens TaxID=90262 RepID=A0A1X2IC75_9FUNG|nr:hypothetical protein BCR42DRAFT_68772 [Absidia repens]